MSQEGKESYAGKMNEKKGRRRSDQKNGSTQLM